MRNFKAVEVLTTGMCPFNCKYCYIPKSPQMKRMHKEIIEDLKSGRFMDRIEVIYDNDLEYLGFWGTEPTLTLPIIQEKLPEIFRRFPKIKSISFSTAMMGNAPEVLFEFAKAVSKYGTELKPQISLDGPAWITDMNRMKGAAEEIPKNLLKVVEMLNRVNLGKTRVIFSWKATHDVQNMKQFIEDPKRVYEYKEYFEKNNSLFRDANKNRNVHLEFGSYIPTLAVPGKYTSEDGKTFTKYVKMMHEMGMETTYTARLDRLFRYEDELYKRCMFSCSGGDSNLGMDTANAHICHRTFYLSDERYVESIIEQMGEENWDISLFRRKTIEHIKKNFITPPEDMDRFNFVMRGHHDFWKMSLAYTNAALIELADAGQIDPKYATDTWLRTTLALFVNAALNCPMENLLNTGSIHLQVLSLLRLFANGAFQEILRKTIELRRKGR
ncbi:MAG: radical SAM protein [Candidatus Thorarchaeota archaeon]